MMDGLIAHGYTVTSFIVPLLLVMLSVIQGSGARLKLPKFIDTPVNISQYVGETAILPCSVRHLGTKEIIWKKVNQKSPVTIGDYVFTGDPSYSLEHGKKKNAWNLVIKNVQKHHSGIYECQISTKEDLRRNITLNILDAPPRKESQDSRKRPGARRKKPKKSSKPAIHISGPKFVEGGSSIKLSCNATGADFPPEDVDWFKNGLKIKGSADDGILVTKYRQRATKTLYSELIIKHSDMKDTGTYICRSSDLEIISHNLMVLNSESNQIKRGTVHETKDNGSVLPNTGVKKPGNGQETMYKHNTVTYLTVLLSLFVVFSVH